jgi:hypothetical protein
LRLRYVYSQFHYTSDGVFLKVLLFNLLIAPKLSSSLPQCVGLRLPSGPPGKLIVGNVFDLPTKQEWVTLSQLATVYGTPYHTKRYWVIIFLGFSGDLVYLKAFGFSMAVISSTNIAYELFEKRSQIYSDRGESPMLRDLCACELCNF